MSAEQAVLVLRRDPKYAARIRASYLDEDTLQCAERFLHSGEFCETRRLLGDRAGGAVLDLGAGTGIASYAFARSGAELVYAIEPDPSDIVGRGAIARIAQGLSVEIVTAEGEALPLADACVDVVYARQVLHHARDLPRLLRDCARVLKSGGVLFACREHVVDDDAQLQAFLRAHPIHQLAGGEHAFPYQAYHDAITAAGLTIERVFGQWDTVINAFPAVESNDELARYPQTLLERRLGLFGKWAGKSSLVRAMVWKRLNRSVPGRLVAFLARKP